MTAGSIAHELRAWTADDLLAAYRQGRREFRAINLLRDELETVCGKRATQFRYSDRPDWEQCNPLWTDYIGIRDDVSWDQSGRCLFDESRDVPESRHLSGHDLTGIDLQGAYLYPIDFSGGSLRGAD